MDVLSVESRTDWITAVSVSARETAKFKRIVLPMTAGMIGSPFHYRMYTGRTYHHKTDGGISLSYDVGDRCLLQAWGFLAHKIAQDVVQNCNCKISRLDLAVSFLFREQQPALQDKLVDLDPKVANYRAIIPINDEGGTLYVGSRKSECFGRIYDKGAQMGTIPPRMYWRYEVEYKRNHAKLLADLVWLKTHDISQRSKVIARQVETFFAKAGLPLPAWTSGSEDYPIVRYATRLTTFSSTLKWMAEQVAPALRRLDCNGYLVEAIDALGIKAVGETPELEGELCEIHEQFDFFDLLQQPVMEVDYTPLTIT
jgi:hypothetical protein